MKKIIILLLIFSTILPLLFVARKVDAATKNSPAEIHIIKKEGFDLTTKLSPNTDEDYRPESRRFQSMAKIQTVGNRIYAGWITGGTFEPDLDNYFVICYSDDGGKTWIDPYMIIDHEVYDEVYIGNGAFLLDDSGKFWIFYNKKGTGLHAITSTNADAKNIDDVVWSKETFCNEYGMENRPTILSTGEWLYTSRNVDDPQKVPVVSSVNHGKNYFTKGNAMSSVGADWKFAGESTIVEKKNGVLVLYSRIEAYGGIERYYSYDEGASWTRSTANLLYPLHGPGSRFVLIALPSGNWLFVTNDSEESRCNLTAYLSKDEGETWSDGLLLDSREGAEYPDATFDDKGNIYVIYDEGRTQEKEIRVCKFTEDDLEASKFVSENSIDKVIITKLNSNYIDIVSSDFGLTRKEVKVGADISSFVKGLPTTITIKDFAGKEYILTGSWKASDVNTFKAGTYYMHFNTTLPDGLQDTYSNLLVIVKVKSETKSSVNVGCASSVAASYLTVFALVGVIFLRKKEKFNEEN